MKDSLLVYSGGMDSTVLLYRRFSEIALCISFNYGSKHNEIEIAYAKKNCTKLGVEHIIVDLPFINKLFSSNLLKSGGEIPEGHYEDESMKKTVVPFRNGIMLSIAAGIAESRGLKNIYIANHAGDHAIYPDCRMEFSKHMYYAIREGTYNQIELKYPFGLLTKRDIAILGADIGVDFSQTWSCYKGITQIIESTKTAMPGYCTSQNIKTPIHCGKCGTCVERKEALKGFDPTNYLSQEDESR